jgi:hypothetical protein
LDLIELLNESRFAHVRRSWITDQHSLAGADDQRLNHKDRPGPGPVQCLVIQPADGGQTLKSNGRGTLSRGSVPSVLQS